MRFMSKKTYLMQTRKPYEQYFFRCKIPKDLDKTFTQKDFTVSLKSSSYKVSKIISTIVMDGEVSVVSWFTRNTKNWHIVYNWLPYSKPIERDALCPDVLVADFQTFKKRKQSWLTSKMEFQYPRYVRI